jgi:hypothetical protein
MKHLSSLYVPSISLSSPRQLLLYSSFTALSPSGMSSSRTQIWIVITKLENQAILLFRNGHYRASAYFYVQAHCCISNISRCPGPLEVSWRRELELQNVRVLLNATIAYLKSAKFEPWLNKDAGELSYMANYFAHEAFESLQQYYGIPENIAQRNVRVLFQAPLDIQLLELHDLAKDPIRPPLDIIPNHRSEWTFILCLVNWSK